MRLGTKVPGDEDRGKRENIYLRSSSSSQVHCRKTVCWRLAKEIRFLGFALAALLLAPMVHWAGGDGQCMKRRERSWFSADAFGRFGSLERTARAPWAPQARRYYYNIVGKYGAQVQALLKKISALEIKTICPLHGPMLTEDLGEYLRLYDLWSQWKPEKPEGILIAHASIHGNTAYASEALKSKLKGKGAQVTMCDLTATDLPMP